MGRWDKVQRSRDAEPPGSDSRSPARFMQAIGGRLYGSLWASFLIFASETEALLARLTKRR